MDTTKDIPVYADGNGRGLDGKRWVMPEGGWGERSDGRHDK